MRITTTPVSLLVVGRFLSLVNHQTELQHPSRWLQKTALEIGRCLKVSKGHEKRLSSAQSDMFCSGLKSLAALIKQNPEALAKAIKLDSPLFAPNTLQKTISHWMKTDQSQKMGLVELFHNPQKAALLVYEETITPLITHLKEVYDSGLLRVAARTHAAKAETCKDPKEKKTLWSETETLYTWLVLVGEQEGTQEPRRLTKDINALRAVHFQTSQFITESQTPA